MQGEEDRGNQFLLTKLSELQNIQLKKNIVVFLTGVVSKNIVVFLTGVVPKKITILQLLKNLRISHFIDVER